MHIPMINTPLTKGPSNFRSFAHALKRSCRRALCAVAVFAGLSVITPSLAQAEEFYLGEVYRTAADFCPRDTIEARGQLLSINQNSALFSLYGANYGGDGRTTFAVPDLTETDPELVGGFGQPELGHYYAVGLRWCARTQGKYPSRSNLAPADASNSGLIIRTGTNFCPENWHKATSDIQPNQAGAPQLTNCVAGTNADIDFGWNLAQIVAADESNCAAGMVPADGKRFDTNVWPALDALIQYAYGGTRGQNFKMPFIPGRRTSAGYLSCVVTEGVFPSRP